VATDTDVVLLAGGRRVVRAARQLAAQTEGNEWSVCGRTDGFAGFEEPPRPRDRSVDPDLDIVVVEHSPGGEWRVSCHANFCRFESPVDDLSLLSSVHDTRQSSHVQQGLPSPVRHASCRTLLFLWQIRQGGTELKADWPASRAGIGEMPRACQAPYHIRRSVAS